MSEYKTGDAVFLESIQGWHDEPFYMVVIRHGIHEDSLNKLNRWYWMPSYLWEVPESADPTAVFDLVVSMREKSNRYSIIERKLLALGYEKYKADFRYQLNFQLENNKLETKAIVARRHYVGLALAS